MKKLVLLAAIALAPCLTSFGQGYFIFSNSAGTAVYDNFSGPSTKSSATVLVSLMFSTDTAAVPLTGSSATATNGAPPVMDWQQVIGDPNFHFATTNGVRLSAATRTGVTVGTFSGGTIGIDNPGLAPGTVVKMYVVGWRLSDGQAGFGTSAFLGWSNPFLLTLGSSSSPGVNLNTAGMQPFGVAPVPEPSTFALAGLGAAAMLIFRRRK
jgi:hypothetical protein